MIPDPSSDLKYSAAKVARSRNEVHGNLVVLVELEATPLTLCSRHHLLPAEPPNTTADCDKTDGESNTAVRDDVMMGVKQL